MRLTYDRYVNRAGGRSVNLEGGGGPGGALCVEMGFYADISWESRCNIEIKCLSSFL